MAFEPGFDQTQAAAVPTLNFAGCGVEVVRAGTPGINPDDPKDFMWQHHAAMYYKLL